MEHVLAVALHKRRWIVALPFSVSRFVRLSLMALIVRRWSESSGLVKPRGATSHTDYACEAGYGVAAE